MTPANPFAGNHRRVSPPRRENYGHRTPAFLRAGVAEIGARSKFGRTMCNPYTHAKQMSLLKDVRRSGTAIAIENAPIVPGPAEARNAGLSDGLRAADCDVGNPGRDLDLIPPTSIRYTASRHPENSPPDSAVPCSLPCTGSKRRSYPHGGPHTAHYPPIGVEGGPREFFPTRAPQFQLFTARAILERRSVPCSLRLTVRPEFAVANQRRFARSVWIPNVLSSRADLRTCNTRCPSLSHPPFRSERRSSHRADPAGRLCSRPSAI